VLVAHRDRGSPAEWRLRPALKRFVCTTFTSVGVFIGLLGIMDRIAPPYADSEGKLITGGAIDHIAHMISYASGLTSPHGPKGIASYPWEWLLDLKPITYLRVNPSLPGDGLNAVHPVTAFFGMISPPIMLLALPGLAFAGYRFLRPQRLVAGGRSFADPQLAIVDVAWFIGTFAPFEVLSALDSRTSYLYYMVIVMPGIYVAVTYLVSLGWRRRRRSLRALTLIWALSVFVAVVLMYPFVAVF
jgi:hypothetical protein